MVALLSLRNLYQENRDIVEKTRSEVQKKLKTPSVAVEDSLEHELHPTISLRKLSLSQRLFLRVCTTSCQCTSQHKPTALMNRPLEGIPSI